MLTNEINQHIIAIYQQGNNEKERWKDMSEKEKKILETIATAVPKMSEFDKGYLLGMGEAMVKQKNEGNTKKESG